MERLKSGLLLLLFGMTAIPAFGQQAPATQQSPGFVAVIGDVENCGNYKVSPDSLLTVRQAVLQAGMLSETVSVKVIRATQDKAQFTQVISANSTDNGEPVDGGDVLVVQSMSPMKSQARSNAALRTGSGVIVVALEGGTKIGDVLRDTQTLLPEEGQLRLICRFQGQPPIAEAKMYTPAVHGDVISVSHDNRRSLKGFGNMAPSVSEWKGRTAAVPALPIPSNPESSSDSSHLSPGTSLDFQTFHWPTTATSMCPATEIEESGELNQPSAVDQKLDAEPLIAIPVSQAEDVNDISVQESTDNKISFASESGTVAPMAPAEMKLGTAVGTAASGFNPWNLVFVGGLLLTGTLILAGTLKPEPDDNTQFIDATARNFTSSLNRSVTVVTSEQQPIGSSPVQTAIRPVTCHGKSSAATDGKVDSTIERPSPVESPKSLVANYEWFGGDWKRQTNSQNTASATETLSECHGADASNAEAISTEMRDVTSSVVETPVAETSDIEIQLDASNETSDLEDLLQNRLPIDLCETQLPLRVALFGKPAGPRRLRIDAAHPTIPAPHMNIAAEKRREQPVTAGITAAKDQTATRSSGGLDHALHFLQERTES